MTARHRSSISACGDQIWRRRPSGARIPPDSNSLFRLIFSLRRLVFETLYSAIGRIVAHQSDQARALTGEKDSNPDFILSEGRDRRCCRAAIDGSIDTKDRAYGGINVRCTPDSGIDRYTARNQDDPGHASRPHLSSLPLALRRPRSSRSFLFRMPRGPAVRRIKLKVVAPHMGGIRMHVQPINFGADAGVPAVLHDDVSVRARSRYSPARR
jgi:hypothetical protein